MISAHDTKNMHISVLWQRSFYLWSTRSTSPRFNIKVKKKFNKIHFSFTLAAFSLSHSTSHRIASHRRSYDTNGRVCASASALLACGTHVPCPMKCQFRQLSGKCHHIISIYGLHTWVKWIFVYFFLLSGWWDSNVTKKVLTRCICQTASKLYEINLISIFSFLVGIVRFWAVVQTVYYYLCSSHFSPSSFGNAHSWAFHAWGNEILLVHFIAFALKVE